MLVELDKKDLINLVSGLSPGFDFIIELEKDGLGRYSGSYGTWNWDSYKLNELTEDQLWGLYTYLKRD